MEEDDDELAGMKSRNRQSSARRARFDEDEATPATLMETPMTGKASASQLKSSSINEKLTPAQFKSAEPREEVKETTNFSTRTPRASAMASK